MPLIRGDRFFINNDFGELIIAKLSPEGYQEISRTHLIAPTTPASQRRTGGKINWTHPAYTNKHILARNDDEIISIHWLPTDGQKIRDSEFGSRLSVHPHSEIRDPS